MTSVKKTICKNKDAFASWKKTRGLDTDAWDEKRNGPLSSRCNEKALGILCDHNYERPAGWNSSSKYWRIMIDTEDDINAKEYYIRCDQLNASQFDHLYALAANRGDCGFDGLKHRVMAWFLKNPKNNKCYVENEDGDTHQVPMSEYAGEAGMFHATRYADDEKKIPVILKQTPYFSFNDVCFRNTAFCHRMTECSEDWIVGCGFEINDEESSSNESTDSDDE